MSNHGRVIPKTFVTALRAHYESEKENLALAQLIAELKVELKTANNRLNQTKQVNKGDKYGIR